MFDTLNQPMVALCFLISGAVWYVAYEFLYMFKEIFSFKVVEFITDFISVLLGVGIFLATSDKVNDGRVIAYEIFCMFVGFFLMRLILKATLRKAFDRMGKKLKTYLNEKKQNLYNSLSTAYTNSKRRKYERNKIRELRLQQNRDREERKQNGMQLHDRMQLHKQRRKQSNGTSGNKCGRFARSLQKRLSGENKHRDIGKICTR